MQAPLQHIIHGQTFWVSAQRCLYWEEQKALILSDLHFGKTGHFRKSGIAVPQNIFKEDLQRLVSLLHYFGPQQIIAVGDLFHSHANLELELFKKWRHDFENIAFRLVKGNHDILKEEWYKACNIEVIEPELHIGNICFTHDNCAVKNAAYTFCGHLHPGVAVHGLGRQTLRFPCFYFAKGHCILPAFSRFTGTAIIQPKKEDVVYALVDNKLMQLQ